MSTPVSWDEVQRGADGQLELRFTSDAVLGRVSALGDLFAQTATLVQRLPRLGA